VHVSAVVKASTPGLHGNGDGGNTAVTVGNHGNGMGSRCTGLPWG